MKKMFLFFLTFYSLSTFAKVKTDTINNWQIYKDKTLLLKSNEFEKIHQLISINTSENFKELKFNIFYDFFGERTSKKIEFIIDKKTIKIFKAENEAKQPFIIEKEKINYLIKKYKNRVIELKYYDRIYPRGISVCKIKFI